MFIRPTLVSADSDQRRKVRDPTTFQHLPAEGANKDGSYWVRRLRSGEVEECDPPPPDAPAEPPAPTPEPDAPQE